MPMAAFWDDHDCNLTFSPFYSLARFSDGVVGIVLSPVNITGLVVIALKAVLSISSIVARHECKDNH